MLSNKMYPLDNEDVGIPNIERVLNIQQLGYCSFFKGFPHYFFIEMFSICYHLSYSKMTQTCFIGKLNIKIDHSDKESSIHRRAHLQSSQDIEKSQNLFCTTIMIRVMNDFKNASFLIKFQCCTLLLYSPCIRRSFVAVRDCKRNAQSV